VIDLVALQTALRGGSSVADARGRRLLDAVRDDAVSPRDIAPLLRQVLLSAEAGIAEPHLVLDALDGLSEACLEAGLACEPYGTDELLVREPSRAHLESTEGRSVWLDLATVAPGELEVDGLLVQTLSRQQRPVPTDPAFRRLTGWLEHPIPEQREAVRQVALAPPGAVTHVVMPTGAGKTIVGLIPALINPSQQVIVVVPTVAIALDQERAIRAATVGGDVWEGTPKEVAWHGELPQEQRALIRDRLLAGTQRVLFTSPESMVTSLEPTLLAAANRGRIHTLVFDEAHLISAWGLDFRPEMQLVASVREQLLEATARAGYETIRTVLLTATLDRRALQLNAALFPQQGGIRIVGAPALRTEPRFLRSTVGDDEERHQRLIEILRIAPRPAIVYATRVATATAVFHHLKGAGFHRVALFTGETGATSRREVLEAWRGVSGPSTVDVVVGTAAFGLGVDQDDVRTVIHVEAPASIGSFYQEVGRGGRDGHACVSVLIGSEKDLVTSTHVGDTTVISPEKAWKRWTAMSSTLSDDAPATVDVRVVPEHLGSGSDLNETWNKNTLVLFERIGLLKLVPQPVPGPGVGDEVWESRRGRVGIDFLLDGHLTFEIVRDHIHALAAELSSERAGERAAVADLLVGRRCFGELFSDAYRFVLDAGTTRVTSRPMPACSGCPACRRETLRAIDVPVAAFSAPESYDLSVGLRRTVGEATTLVVHDDAAWLDRNGPELLTRLVEAGCRHLFLSTSDRRLERALGRLPYVAVDQRIDGFRPFVRPSVIWRPDTADTRWRAGGGAPRVIVVESGMQAPDRPDHPLEEWWAPARRASRLLEQL
jgi:ATP-dependent DNA helicase RecQ